MTDEQLKAHHKDGYLLLKNLFDKEEIEFLKQTVRADRELDQRSYESIARAERYDFLFETIWEILMVQKIIVFGKSFDVYYISGIYRGNVILPPLGM